MHDGTVLRADAWVPATGGPWPVLLQRLPYGRAVASTPVLPHPEHLARRGYAVVVQDVRGRGDSEGMFAPFVDDGLDGAQTIEWAARLPFCDGQVATYGFSYQGLNQLAAAARRPPSLRAIAPMMCSTEPYEHWTYEGGCLRWSFVAPWAAQLAGQEPGAAPPPVRLDALPAAEALGMDPPPWFVEWLAHPARDTYWEQRAPELDRIAVPVFTVLGYFDDFAAGTEQLFEQLGAEGVCGPWSHMPWGTRLCGVELGPDASPSVAHEALVAFFDHVLKGAPPREPRVVWFDNAGGWRASATWPPPHEIAPWHATSGGHANSRYGDGRLEPGDAAGTLTDVLVGEPLVPYPGGLDPLSDEGPAEDRRDVLCYTSAPLPNPLTLAGSCRVTIDAEADVETFDLVVSLVDVDECSVPRRLATGARRVHYAAGGIRVDVMLHPVGWTLVPGHRLRLDVSLSRFPAFDRNAHLGRGHVPAYTGRHDCRVATVHVQAVTARLPVVHEGPPKPR